MGSPLFMANHFQVVTCLLFLSPSFSEELIPPSNKRLIDGKNLSSIFSLNNFEIHFSLNKDPTFIQFSPENNTPFTLDLHIITKDGEGRDGKVLLDVNYLVIVATKFFTLESVFCLKITHDHLFIHDVVRARINSLSPQLLPGERRLLRIKSSKKVFWQKNGRCSDSIFISTSLSPSVVLNICLSIILLIVSIGICIKYVMIKRKNRITASTTFLY